MPGKSARVLLIDDDTSITNLFKKILDQGGYDVEIRNNPIEALKMINTGRVTFDIVITDLDMPEMNGDALAQEIKKVDEDLPVVLCTGFPHKIEEAYARETSIRTVMVKPVRAKTLVDTVDRVLSEQG